MSESSFIEITNAEKSWFIGKFLCAWTIGRTWFRPNSYILNRLSLFQWISDQQGHEDAEMPGISELTVLCRSEPIFQIYKFDLASRFVHLRKRCDFFRILWMFDLQMPAILILWAVFKKGGVLMKTRKVCNCSEEEEWRASWINTITVSGGLY